MTRRRYSVGAELTPDGATDFRVWAPKCLHMAVVLEDHANTARVVPMTGSADGHFAAQIANAGPGTRYRFRVDDEPQGFPDPASRFQPEGPHGPSEVVDANRFPWTDDGWTGIARTGQVIYEMHIGTFTEEGTWRAATGKLDQLAAMGITTIELMPVAEFPGQFGWGYDGVNLFAPTRLYGTPDDFRRFVDAAHARQLGVILDVVYNHFGPDGNYLRRFADEYFSDRYKNDWGESINFDGPGAGPVREFYGTNAAYWIEEFHLDGLRLDATQQIFDASPRHILADIAERVRKAAPRRSTFIVAENECQEARLVRPQALGGYGLDAIWNDDFHHSAMVALTGRNDAYYHDHLGTPQEFISAAKWGFLFQGQRYDWQKARRGHPALDIEPARFVNFLQNHDQIANSCRGLRTRFLTSPGRFRAMTALLLLGPATPMLFQGQEFGATSPFFYFADHQAELARLVRDGRRNFLAQFSAMTGSDLLEHVPDPHAYDTFLRCKVKHGERDQHKEIVELHQDLIKLRQADPAFREPRPRGLDGAVLGPAAFVLRFFGAGGGDRLLIVSLGTEFRMPVAPEPLLAPPEGSHWSLHWSSEDWRYGGSGHAPVEDDSGWHIPAEAAVVLIPMKEG